MQQPFILGIDIGTGSTKAVAVNLSGEPFLTSQAYYNTSHPKPGYSEQDPEMIWQAFLTCISAIQQQLRDRPLAISLSSVMHSLIPVNGDGYPIHPMITWVDARSAAIAERVRASAEGETIYRDTGTPVFAMSPLTKIIWFKEKEPGIFNNTFKFISIKEYIWFRLFGAFEVDHSIASGAGMLDILTLQWSNASLQLAGITADRLSTPVNTGYTRSDFNNGGNKLTAIKDGTPFVIGGSDGCLANLGSLAIEKGVAAITIGTSGAVRMANPSPVYNFQAMTFNYRLDEETFICGGPVNNGGIAVQWWLKHIKGTEELSGEDYTTFFESIEMIPPGSEGLLFLPYLTGERAPVWDTKSTGVFL
jgi:gluconokinase